MQVLWETSLEPQEYEQALNKMENYVDSIINKQSCNKIWLLEHFDIYTKGTSTNNKDILINRYNIPIINTNRGGQITYHGIGQRVIYLMIDLSESKDIKKYIQNLEQWIILSLQEFNINAFTKEGIVGIWIKDSLNTDKKVASIGIRVRKWVAYHGVSINVNPDLNKFKGIVPCGIRNFSIDSLESLNKNINFNNLDKSLKKNFNKVFF